MCIRRRQQWLQVKNKSRSRKIRGYEDFDLFHRAIKPFIFFAQLFGIMPLKNVLHPNPNRMQFRICSGAMFFTAFFFVFGGIRTMDFTKQMMYTGINSKNIVHIVFFYMNMAACINFLLLARRWPNLIRNWTRLELIFLLPPYEDKTKKSTLQKRIRFVACVFLTMGFFEHFMYFASGYYSYRIYNIYCNNSTRTSFRDYIVYQEFKDLFQTIPFNIVFAVYAFFINGAFAFIWNYLDLFIMLVSLGLATRFEQFAMRVQKFSGKFVPDILWYNIRQHHMQLCELMELVDEHMSTLILLSSLNNTYFICNQLLNIFIKQRWPINYAYLWFSLAVLISRTACVFMFASKIHDASLLPLQTLYVVPADCWSEEVQRFRFQITNEEIGLTGKRFFLVTRKNLFGLFGTIITYEFMLLQFDAKNRISALPELCA